MGRSEHGKRYSSPVRMGLEGKAVIEKVSFFSADYRDGRVHLGGKAYHAGTFAVHLLNQYYKDDTAARIGVFKLDNMHLQDTLDKGYMAVSDYLKAGEEMLYIFHALPCLKPFDMLDISSERSRVDKLFTEENGEKIVKYFRRRAKVMAMDDDAAALDLLPTEYDKAFFKEADALLKEVTATLLFYDRLSEDMQKAFNKLRTFVKRVDEAERFDEHHLLPIAMEVFGSAPFAVKTEYVSIPKTAKSKVDTLARRLYFESYYSFIITDFFEGLHYGHYPRQCGICKKYFLMTSAARQKYCNGYAPVKLKGKAVTCRKYAARIKRKELSEGDPVLRIYKNRCSAIRVEKSRGTITEEFATAALSLAKEHMQRARNDEPYAANQYEADMSREQLYADTDRDSR